MNNYQLYRTNVLLGGQMKYDLILSQNSNNHNIDIKDIHITPISNNAPYNKYIDDDVLNYNHIENIKTFYKKTSGSFYKTFINPALNNLYPLPEEYKEIKETTYEMGCRRKSNQLYDKQFEFLCPVWLEQIEDFEDLSFEIQIKTNPTSQNIITKKIVFKDKLAKYFDDYTKLLGLYDGYDWVFNISKQNCIVSGVDVKNGTCKELRLSNFYNDLLYRERPLLEVNNLIINELNKHNLITRQLFNFNLCFNISDILGFYTFNQLKDYPLYINVVVCINDKPLDLRDIFSNHEYIDKPISEIPTLSINNGEISISEERSGINVLDYLNDNKHIDLVDKNKILQNTCHWEYSNIKGSIFNLYDGFCGVFKAVDNTGTGGDSGNTGTGGDSGNTGTDGTSPIPDVIYNYPSGDNILMPGVIAWPFGTDYVHEDSNEGPNSDSAKAYADKIYEKLFDLLNHKEPPTEEEKDEFDDYFTDLSYDLYHWATFGRITIPDVGEVGPVKLLLVSLNCSCNNNHERGKYELAKFAEYVKKSYNDPTSYPKLDSKYKWNVLPVPNSQDSSNGGHGYIFYSNDYNEIIAIQQTAAEWGWEPKNDNSDYVSSWFEITEWIKMYKLYERISETGEQYPYPYNKINMAETLHNTRILRELIQNIMHRWYVECTWSSKSSKTAIKPISVPQPQQFKYYNSKYYNGFSTDLNMTDINEIGYPYWCNAYKVQNLYEILCDMINDTSRYQNLFSTFSQNCVINNINYHAPTKDMQNIDVIMLQTDFGLTEDELSQLNKRITEIHINGIRKWHAYQFKI